MNSSSLDFSVVVPACARPAALAECLARLAPGAQTFPAAQYEVIVTDDSPDASIRDLVANRFPWAQWTAGPRRGPAANRNHGARQARAAWLAFTDDDCLPDPGWLAAYFAARQTYPAARVLEGRTYADRPRRSLAERSPVNTHGGYLWSCNLAVRADLFHRLAAFDEGFPYAAMEDVDFARRLRAAGAREQFVESAGVCHPWREIPGFRAMWTVEERYCASLRHFLALHPDAWSEYTVVAGLKTNLRHLLRETLPGVFRWHGRGFPAALAWHAHQLKRLGFLFRSRPLSMNMRQCLKRPLYRAPRLLGALMRLKSNWNRETYIFLNTVRRGDHVLDVGANLGEFTELFARLVGPRGSVAAFEPVPPTYVQLQNRLRPWPRVTTHNVAVSDHPGEVLLNLPDKDCGQASLRPHHAGSWKSTATVTVHRAEAITLDQWSEDAQWPRVDFIKLDIEGAELLALRGASRLVRKHQPLLFVEVWQEWLRDFGFSPRDLADWLRDHGYNRFLAVENTLTPLPDLEDSWAPCLARGPHNLLAGISHRHAGRWPGW